MNISNKEKKLIQLCKEVGAIKVVPITTKKLSREKILDGLILMLEDFRDGKCRELFIEDENTEGVSTTESESGVLRDVGGRNASRAEPTKDSEVVGEGALKNRTDDGNLCAYCQKRPPIEKHFPYCSSGCHTDGFWQHKRNHHSATQ